jgi:hypothetical protein
MPDILAPPPLRDGGDAGSDDDDGGDNDEGVDGVDGIDDEGVAADSDARVARDRSFRGALEEVGGGVSRATISAVAAAAAAMPSLRIAGLMQAPSLSETSAAARLQDRERCLRCLHRSIRLLAVHRRFSAGVTYVGVNVEAQKAFVGEVWARMLLSTLRLARDAVVRMLAVVLCCVVYCRVLSCTVVYCRVLSCTVVYCRAMSCTVVYCHVVSFLPAAVSGPHSRGPHPLAFLQPRQRVCSAAVGLLRGAGVWSRVRAQTVAVVRVAWRD